MPRSRAPVRLNILIVVFTFGRSPAHRPIRRGRQDFDSRSPTVLAEPVRLGLTAGVGATGMHRVLFLQVSRHGAATYTPGLRFGPSRAVHGCANFGHRDRCPDRPVFGHYEGSPASRRRATNRSRASVGMRLALPIETDSRSPAAMSSNTFVRPSPRLSAASSTRKSNLGQPGDRSMNGPSSRRAD